MYDIVLTDRSYVPQGQILEASNVQYLRGNSKLATLSFQVPMKNDHVDRLAAVDGFIKLYRKKTLLYVGPIISTEESAERETRSLAITSADAGWFLGKLLVGKSATGSLWTSPTLRHDIAKTCVDAVNSVRETGISTTDYTWSSGSAITYKAGPYGNTLQIVQDLGSALDGFDWFIRPKENWINGAVASQKIGSMQVATIIGTTKADVVFEYGMGTRSNVLSYAKTTTRDQQASTVYHLGSNPGDPKTGTNSGANTTWGLLEDVVQGDFTDSTMRQKLVDEHALVRGNPRTLIRLTPHIDPGVTGRVPEPFVDYDIGDTITFRAVADKKVRFSGTVRVYGIRTSIDPSGFERVELILEDE